jgi:hypothetical protein
VTFAPTVADNTGDLALTIDKVSVVGAVNLTVKDAVIVPIKKTGTPYGVGGSWLDARWHDAPKAVDHTLEATGRRGSMGNLALRLQLSDATKAAALDHVTVDYHNTDGRFRAVGKASLAVKPSC